MNANPMTPATAGYVLLLDVGNTNTHLGLARGNRLMCADIPTVEWDAGAAQGRLVKWVGNRSLAGIAIASVVPKATPAIKAELQRRWHTPVFELSAMTLTGVGLDYPKPATIGADRLANAVAARQEFGAPVVVVDFGTAVTFDVVDRGGNYAGGIIAPGLAAMTDYLHEKTALLPRIKIRECKQVIGKSTEQAMLIGAVHGYRGLVRELISELKRELKCKQLPVIATGGCARLIAGALPEIRAVRPNLTLEGLRLAWQAHGC